MRNRIEIDGKSSRCFGLKMARLPLWTTAAETVENVALPGVPVGQDRHTGQYQDFELTLTGYLTRMPAAGELSRLNAWLQGGKQLVMSTQPQLYGVIRRVGQIEPVRVGTRANEIQIPFTFQPFKYSRENFPVALSSPPVSFRYFGNIFSEPVYRLNVESDAEFTVNGTALTLTGLTGGITVDLQRRKIYREDAGVLTIVQEQTAGAFWDMVLRPGVNEIAWTEGITGVSVTVNERWL